MSSTSSVPIREFVLVAIGVFTGLVIHQPLTLLTASIVARVAIFIQGAAV